MSFNQWLTPSLDPRRPVRLYCFSYTGGGTSSYMPWQRDIDASVEICAIQMPGRERRMFDLPVTSLPELVSTIATTISQEEYLDFAFFGHSFGAFLAFEVAKYCDRMNLVLPKHLFLSGCVAPQYRRASRLHELSDIDLIEELRSYNGTPPELLENEELMALVLPVIRADSALAGNYEYTDTSPLPIPFTVLAGNQDKHVPLPETQSWSELTTGSCDFRTFEGDHFFIRSQYNAVMKLLNSVLKDIKFKGEK
ncbi:thioesterase II family protein [Janthinobacterium sp. GB4P2]|uniref:thioesterase II family protein n=1 Tax=Janthinobacterium sp. GB4P2 TaxID=3424189 RepID=UPI003F292781